MSLRVNPNNHALDGGRASSAMEKECIADIGAMFGWIARKVFDDAAKNDLHLALIELPAEFVANHVPEMAINADTVTCLRSVLMKPEHRDWTCEIVSMLESSAP